MNAGVMEDGEIEFHDKGVPQGALCKALHKPPCGHPASVGKSLLSSTNPDFNHFLRTTLSVGIFFIDHS